MEDRYLFKAKELITENGFRAIYTAFGKSGIFCGE